jgi:hypothetical protein
MFKEQISPPSFGIPFLLAKKLSSGVPMNVAPVFLTILMESPI